MKRNIAALIDHSFDLIVVGGGIFGACAVWEAALRGLSVALIEKKDFSHATSANHYKMAHCGIRYLQHGDIRRLRESSRERSALMRIAPHLVHTMPIVIPTYGHGSKGKIFLGTGMFLYDLMTMDRNQGLLPEKKIQPSRFFSAAQVIECFPGINRKGLTGAAVFEEGQIYNPPRLALAFIKAAADKGATPLNYVKAQGFIKNGNRIQGVKAIDQLTGNQLEIRGRVVLNTAGPWAHRLLASGLGFDLSPPPVFSRDFAFVIPRRFDTPYGLALATETKDADSIVDRGGRHLFVVPWRDYNLIGVWHKIFDGPSEELTVTENELNGYVNEVNSAYPGLISSLDDITMINMGLTLFGEEEQQGAKQISFGKRSQVIDHQHTHGVEGLLTLIGVRATTARGMAAEAIKIIADRLGQKSVKVDSTRIPINGGNIDDLDMLIKNVSLQYKTKLTSEHAEALVRNYGSAYRSVLQYAQANPALFETVPGGNVLKSEIVHAVREEMAQKLSDVVFRRTDLGTGEQPSSEALDVCAAIMSKELDWDSGRCAREIEDARQSCWKLNKSLDRQG
jgi:glycerol-3-phosphate dehydrogenase